MSGSVATSDVADHLEAEDLARARWYGFFSRWLLAPADQQAIDSFLQPRDRQPPEQRGRAQSSDLAEAWLQFTGAVAGSSLAAMRTAYDETFISVGEAPVSLHASVYLTGFANERPLAEVRQWLADQGIQGSQSGLLTEDHLGLLCEVMAWLIMERGDAAQPDWDAPQQFLFSRFIAPVCDAFCRRLEDAPDTGVYRAFGRLFAAFCAIERQAFNIDR